jgi:hypothetical protein
MGEYNVYRLKRALWGKVTGKCNMFAGGREGGSIIIVMQGPSAEARKQWSGSYEEARQKISVFYRK